MERDRSEQENPTLQATDQVSVVVGMEVLEVVLTLL
jgi:hypothetical protein